MPADDPALVVVCVAQQAQQNKEEADSLTSVLEPLDIIGDRGNVISNIAGDSRHCHDTHGQSQDYQAWAARLNVEGEGAQGDEQGGDKEGHRKDVPNQIIIQNDKTHWLSHDTQSP